jgi:hypothetical protein
MWFAHMPAVGFDSRRLPGSLCRARDLKGQDKNLSEQNSIILKAA